MVSARIQTKLRIMIPSAKKYAQLSFLHSASNCMYNVLLSCYNIRYHITLLFCVNIYYCEKWISLKPPVRQDMRYSQVINSNHFHVTNECISGKKNVVVIHFKRNVIL